MAKSYRDDGSVDDTFVTGHETTSKRTTFSTRFDRASSAFRFTFDGGDARGTLWRRSSGDVWTWASFEAAQKKANLEDGIAAFTGTSRGASHTVPTLLVGQRPAERIFEDVRVDGDADIDGTACWVLIVEASSYMQTFSVRKQDGALLRTFVRQRIDPRDPAQQNPWALAAAAAGEISLPPPGEPFLLETTTNYSPQFDVPIPPSEFDGAPKP